MRKSTILFASILLTACSSNLTPQAPTTLQEVQMKYPTTAKDDVIDRYFGKRVEDPYRWLEDDRSTDTSDWVQAQNSVTFDYLAQIPYRNSIKKRLETLWNYEKIGAPFTEGNYTYYYKNNGLQSQDVVYRKADGKSDEVFLDPNTFSDEGTTSLATLSFSKDGSIAAYAISEGGSDWRKIIIIDAETKEQLEAPIVDVKFSGISWKGNEGFFYSSYDKPDGSALSAKTDQHKLYFHKLGTKQSEDRVIYGGNADQKRRYVSGRVTEDDKFLVITAANSTSGNELYLKNLDQPEKPVKTVLSDFESDTYLIDSRGNQLFFVTNLDAPNQKIVVAEAENPMPENWKDIIPESKHVLSPIASGGYFYAEYMIDALSAVYQYDYEGNKVREIKLPGIGNFYAKKGKKDDTTLYYSFTNYKTPSTIYAFNPANGESTVYRKSQAKFDSDNYVSKQVFYFSKDGTKVPMIITHKKGVALTGKNPTILYGYGGFNISVTPSFKISNAVWLEQGGIYAVPNIRGGGEYGRNWHLAGTQLNKQNVFDDFIAAAEYLIDNKYTSSEYLALHGGSNGGLLVGAVMTQRPNLAKVALPAVGVLDMLRYHKFTSGAGWAFDYGTSDQSEEMFEYLKAYSPLHNVKEDTSYPATLITTGDHDDRVVPAHSFKFAAELQAKQQGNTPTLIRIETDAGHGAGRPVSKTVEMYADMFAFTLFNMGFESTIN